MKAHVLPLLAVLTVSMNRLGPLPASSSAVAPGQTATACTGPSFSAVQDYASASYPQALAAGDFNGDRWLDLATANRNSADVSILLGSGDGSLQPAVNYSTGVGARGVTVADFNHDRKPDIAVANSVDNTMSVLHNTCATLHVANITAGYRPLGNRYRLNARFTIDDGSGIPAPGAMVSFTVTLPNGHVLPAARLTDAQGVATAQFTTAHTGTYIFTVTAVRKPGYTYDPSQNIQTSISVRIP